MSLNKMTKDELELLSNKDITNLILEESKKSLNTAELFKKIVKLLELPDSYFETKIGDYYTALTTDKRFVLLEDGTWDLRSRHTSDKVIKVISDDEDEEDEDVSKDDTDVSEEDEDNYDDTESDDYDDDTEDDLKDLVVLDEDELELEQ